VKEPVWVHASDALAIHVQLLTRHGGATAVRNEGILESVLARPRQQFVYPSPDIIDMASACTSGVVQNHSFVDGNERTAFVVGVLLLDLNGLDFTASEAETSQAVLELTAGTIDETGFALFLQDHLKRARKRK